MRTERVTSFKLKNGLIFDKLVWNTEIRSPNERESDLLIDKRKLGKPVIQTEDKPEGTDSSGAVIYPPFKLSQSGVRRSSMKRGAQNETPSKRSEADVSAFEGVK